MSNSQRPFRFGVQLGTPLSRSELLDAAREAEDLGYEVFSCTDHIDDVFPQLSPMVALAAVAAVTSSIELQPLVLANDLRHPVVLAKEAATLDVLSEGRFAFGVGAGWLPGDFSKGGRTFSRPGVRIARLREALAIYRGLQDPEPFNFQGEHFTVSNLVGSPLPVRKPIPLMVGGSGEFLLTLAAREADTVALNPGLPMSAGDWRRGETPYADATDAKLSWIHAAGAGRGRLPEIQATILAGGITAGDPEPLLTPLAAMLGVEAAKLSGSPHVLAGSLEQCIETVQGWRDRWGISYLTLPLAMAGEMAPLVAALRGK